MNNAANKKINVLVIEDNEDDLFFIKKSLSDDKYIIRVITDGEDAFHYLQNPEIVPDIILLDNKLPGMNGLDIIEKICKEKFDYSFIFLTVDNTIDMVVKAMRAGALDFIVKSADLKCELPEKIEKVYQIHRAKIENKEFEAQLIKTKVIAEESEEKLKEAQHLAHMGNWELNIETDQLYWSDEIYRIFDCQPQEFNATYEAFLQFIHPDDKEKVNAAYVNSLETKTEYQIEHRLITKNNQIKYVIEKCKTTFNEQGKPLISNGIVIDITEHKALENEAIDAKEKTEQSEENLRFLFENMIQGVVYHKPSGEIILANEAAAFILGLSLDQLYGKTSLNPRWKSIHEDGTAYPGETHPVMTTIKTKKPVKNSIMGIFIPEKNVYSWININSIPKFDHKNELIQVVVTFEDITGIRNAKEKAEESEEKFSVMFQKAPFAAALSSISDFKLVEVNEQFEKLWGYSSVEVIGKTSHELGLYPDDNERSRLSAIFREKGFLLDEESKICSKTGEMKDILVNSNIVKVGNEQFGLSTVQNITMRKKAEENLTRMSRIMQNSQEIAHLGSFEYVAANQTTIWSEEEYRIYGLDPNSPSPEYNVMLEKCIHPDDAKLLNDTFTAAMQNNRIYELEHRIVRPDGSIRWVYDKAHPYFDEQGNLLRYVGASLDITERKLAEDMLREKDIQFRKLSANVPDLLFQFTRKPDGTYCVPIASEGIKNIFGCSPEDVLEDFTPIARVIFPGDAVSVISDIEYSAKHLTYFTCEFRVQIPGKPVQWIFSKSTPEKLPDGSITWYGFAADITERKQAEILLREKNSEIEAHNEEYKQINEELFIAKEHAEQGEKQFRQLFENMEQGFAVHKMIYDNDNKPIDYRFLRMNKAFEKLTGANAADYIGKTVKELMPNTESKWIENYGKVAQTGESLHFEKYAQEFNKYYDIIAYSPKKDHFAVVFTDITERRKTELIIHQNNARLKILLGLSQMAELDIKEIFNYALEKSTELCSSKIGFLGFLNEHETIVSIHAWSASAMKICEIKDKYFDFEVAKTGIWGEVIRQRKPLMINDFKADNPLKRGVPKGHVEIINYLSIPVFDKGKIVAVLAVGNKPQNYNETDVQELTLFMEGVWNIVKQHNYEKDLIIAKEQAEESKEQYKSLSENSKDYIIRFDRNHKHLYINKITYDLLQIKPEQLLNKTHRESGLFNAEQCDFWEQSINKVFETNEIVQIQFDFYNGKETIYFDWMLIPEKNNKNIVENVLSVTRDITKLKKYEKELVSSKEKAEESDRLKSNFLNNMSHEVRTPLNAIQGFSRLITKPNQPPEKLKKFSELINSGSEKLTAIINDVIEISQIQANIIKPKLIETEITALLKNIVSGFEKDIKEKNIAYKLHNPFNELIMLMDIEKFKRIVSHLIDNAIKFTHQGSVEISCELLEGDCNKILQLIIRDTGIGISEEMQELIFIPFRQVEMGITRNYGGNGLGLSIAKAFTELLNGTISLKSQINKGSEFTILLPVTSNQSQIIEKRDCMKKENIKTVLIVEDEYSNYQYLVELLEKYNFNILYADNGQNALDLCHNQSDIDLILMDIKMPIMDGHTATVLIKQFRPNIPIIAQTAYALETEKDEYSGIFDDYITKPISEETLNQKMMKYIEK